MKKLITNKLILIHVRFLQVEEQFLKTSGCKMPWMLTKLVDSLCEKPKSLETLAKFMIDSKKNECGNDPCSFNMTLANQACPKVHSCSRSIFDFQESSTEKSQPNSLKIIIEKDYVVYVTDFISYDFYSFFGEVGGTLGLLLGYSLAHIFEFLIHSVKLKYGSRKKNSSWCRCSTFLSPTFVEI